MVAGSCSAADAKCLQTIRKEKKYRALGLTWEQLCKEQLGISRSTADQIIRDLEECGEAYFPMARVTGITAEQYRRLRPPVSGQKLLHAGQEIPIDAEHAAQLTAAIEEMRRTSTAEPVKEANGVERALTRVEKSLRAAVSELERLNGLGLDADTRVKLHEVIRASSLDLKLLELAARG